MNANGREVVIVEAVRTPIGRGHPEKGYYKDTHPNELLGKTYTEVIERAGIPAEAVEDVICGCVQQYGEQMFNVGRNAWLQAGLPVETPATTVDRQCGSAQQAVNFGAALIAAGVHDVVIGGGVEHMGHIPMGVGFKWVDDVGSPWPPELLEQLQPRAAGDLGRDDRRPVGDPAVGDGRAGRALAPARRARHRGGPLRARDGAVPGQRLDLRGRPGHPARHEPRGARRPQAGLQAGRQGHGRQLVADLRRRRRGAADERREGSGAGRHAARADRRPDDRRRRPGDDAHRPDPGHPEAARAQRDDAWATSTSWRSTRRSRRSCSPGSASWSRTWTA